MRQLDHALAGRVQMAVATGTLLPHVYVVPAEGGEAVNLTSTPDLNEGG